MRQSVLGLRLDIRRTRGTYEFLQLDLIPTIDNFADTGYGYGKWVWGWGWFLGSTIYMIRKDDMKYDVA